MGAATPAFIVFLIILTIWVLSVRQDRMIVPIIIAMCFLPADISLKLGSLDFQAVRILALAGIAKIYSSSNKSILKFNTIDKIFILYNMVGAVIYIIASENTSGALLYKSGACIDRIVLYIVFRHIIQSKEDLRLIIKTFSACVIALLPFVIFEFFSAQNLFSIVGRSGISIRHGEIRAAATFSHAILFGSFAAALVPILWADYMIRRSALNIVAVMCCIFFIYACSSSGPIVAIAGAIFFLSFFKWKQHGSSLAWFMLATATFIHFVRESPLWHFLYLRVTIKASSTGLHRYLLVDAAVKDFWDWWLIGYGDLGPQWHLKYWPWSHANFTDVTNHYLAEGVRGGFITMVLFISLCFIAIKTLGSFSVSQNDVEDQWLWWGFMVMMITHCLTFLSVAYFGQITMLLYLTIAVAALAYDESNRSLTT